MLSQLYNKIYDYRLFLCDFQKNIISEINYSNINYKPYFDNFNELDFSLEYYENSIIRIKDENYNLTKANYIIYMEIFNSDEIVKQEYFTIDNPNNMISADGIFTKSIHCWSLPYSTFQMRKLRGYQNQVRTLYDPNNQYSFTDNTKGGILNLLLQNYLYGSWTVGYINSKYLGVYHTFSFSDSTYIDVIKQLEQSYNCFILFDSVNNQINIYSPEEVGQHLGLVISHTNYLKSLSTNTKLEGLVTRLRVTGKNDATIAKYNITGELFLENYNYFLDEMSDSLKTSMIAWTDLKESKSGDFTCYVDQLDSLETQLLTKQNELVVLNQELIVIQTNMKNEINNSYATTYTYTQLVAQQSAKQSQISTKQSEITSINSQITTVNNNINALHNLLKLENNFTNEQLKELSNSFIKEDTLNMSDVSNEKQLYEYAVAYLAQKSNLPITLDIDLIDILSCSECQDDWDKINLGDFVYLDVPELGYDYQELRIVQYDHNKTNNSLRVTLSNTTELNNDLQQLNDIFKLANQVANTVVVNQDNYGQYTQDQDTIVYNGDTINTTNNPIVAGNIQLNQFGFTGTDIGSYGTLQLLNDKLVISTDGMQTYHTILSGNGLYLERSDGKSRIVINPTYGIQIDKKVGSSWNNSMYIDTDGNAIFAGVVKGGRIDVDTDANIGNNLYIGDKNTLSDKGIYFYNSGGQNVGIQMLPNGSLSITTNHDFDIWGSEIDLVSANGNITLGEYDLTRETYLNKIRGLTEFVFGYRTIFSNDVQFGNTSKIGFFGNTPIERKTATYLDSAATLSDVISKINGILGIFSRTNYGLIDVS